MPLNKIPKYAEMSIERLLIDDKNGTSVLTPQLGIPPSQIPTREPDGHRLGKHPPYRLNLVRPLRAGFGRPHQAAVDHRHWRRAVVLSET